MAAGGREYEKGDKVLCWCPEYGSDLWFLGVIGGKREGVAEGVWKYKIKYKGYGGGYVDLIKKCVNKVFSSDEWVPSWRLMPFDEAVHGPFLNKSIYNHNSIKQSQLDSLIPLDPYEDFEPDKNSTFM